jgi:hypothetical protein
MYIYIYIYDSVAISTQGLFEVGSMGRSASEPVTVQDLHDVLEPFVTRPGWIEYTDDMKKIKVSPLKILKLKEMWRKMRDLVGDRIVLKDSDLKKALVKIAVANAEEQAWQRLCSADVEKWAQTTSLRMRCQARAIAQTTSHAPTNQWLQVLWGAENEAEDCSDKEGVEEEDDEEEAPEDEGSDDEALVKRPASIAPVVMKKPAATSPETAIPSDSEYFYGYCPKRKEAFRCPTDDVENKAKWEYSDAFEVPLEPSSIHIML